MRAIISILTAALFLQVPSPQTPDLWTGTWKFNPTKSHLIPSPLTITQQGSHYTLQLDGTYHFDCNGQADPAPGSQTLRCTPQGTGMDIERYRAGKPAGSWQLRPNADGRTMTVTSTDIFPGVPPAIQHDEYRRATAGKPTVIGTWTGVRTTLEGGDIFTFRVHDGYFYFKDARDGEASDAKLDGTPAPFLGENIETGVTWTNKLETERRYVGHAVGGGKTLNTEVFELSPDGKSIKAIQPGTGNPSIYIYERQ